ncbi:hypothetical protein AJ78_01410 [Emergomyces pasteurianus Ep9510]|uniref:AA1-like domain-containing protein n=1 Tax=Emergomyces pasteurianus Ep9510 TaxID=1447872 RepID=A0A1J9PQ55_9EURO|nr:hypothetical protein AJ78_01410 [Emergomyces pasteurianus Ep9510]
MKFSVYAFFLAATSAVAAPATIKLDGQFSISGLRARKALDHTMSFTLLDTAPTGGNIPIECNMIWPSNSAPDQNAACGPEGEYLLKFPDGFAGIGHFTLAIERVTAEPIGGRAYLDENDGKWNCVDNPEPHVVKDCHYNGIYIIPL